MLPGKLYLYLVLGISNFVPIYAVTKNLKVAFEWGQLEFDYPSLESRQEDIDSGQFTPGILAPVDIDGYYNGTQENPVVFVTIPRFTRGVPATLGTITDKLLNGNPIIKPYPDWSWNRNPDDCNPNRLVSVFRVTIDQCGRLWVLDTGKIGDSQICPGQIMAFDLLGETDQVLHRHEFGSEINLLVTPVVDIRTSCDNAFVYIADSYGFQMFVYDVANGRSWRIRDKTFYPYPNYGTFTVAEESFDLMDGVLGLALEINYNPRGDRKLFYHAMSSPTENWVYTSYLKNYSLFENNPSPAPEIFHTYEGKRRSQAGAQAMDQSYGITFFGLMSKSQIACWNSNTAYGPMTIDIVAGDNDRLQFPIAVKVILNDNGDQEVWVLSDRYQKIANGTINPNETNFRILKANVEYLLRWSKCKRS